ncbi:hypothetical protein ACVRY7_07525 [Streptococcus ictaluri]|nr:hypothetical protein [Streptococcus ictaluri]
MATLITIKNLKLMLKDHIYLDIPKFTIPKGSFYCLVGESGGGGKSLLAKSILGIQDNEFKITGVVENFSRQSDLILQNASDNLQLYWSVGKQAHHLLKSRFKLSKKRKRKLNTEEFIRSRIFRC